MRTFIGAFKPKDCIAILVVVCATLLIMSGRDGIIGLSLLGVVTGYYGLDLTPFVKVGRRQKKEEEKPDEH